MSPQLTTWLASLEELPHLDNVHGMFNGPQARVYVRNLCLYFESILPHWDGVLLVGEAPGYQGTYRTGLPFCSEYILMGPANKFGTFGGEKNGYQLPLPSEKVWKEPSATIVQRVIEQLPTSPLMWATFPMHPHKPGKELSNRAPNKQEVAIGAEVLERLLNALQPRHVVAVGNIADTTLTSLGVEHVKVRHPSHGGAKLFEEQFLNFYKLLST